MFLKSPLSKNMTSLTSILSGRSYYKMMKVVKGLRMPSVQARRDFISGIPSSMNFQGSEVPAVTLSYAAQLSIILMMKIVWLRM